MRLRLPANGQLGACLTAPKRPCRMMTVWIECSVLVDKYGNFYPRCPMATDSLKHKARTIFQEHGGLLRTKDAIQLGIHPRTLYDMREGNSRMKDFADLWFLARHFSFDGRLLAQAVRDTFERRQTPLQTQPMALTPAFAQIEAKQTQWKAFLRRSSPEGTPTDLADVIDAIAIFLLPILAHLAADNPLPRTWDAPGPWQM